MKTNVAVGVVARLLKKEILPAIKLSNYMNMFCTAESSMYLLYEMIEAIKKLWSYSLSGAAPEEGGV